MLKLVTVKMSFSGLGLKVEQLPFLAFGIHSILFTLTFFGRITNPRPPPTPTAPQTHTLHPCLCLLFWAVLISEPRKKHLTKCNS